MRTKLTVVLLAGLAAACTKTGPARSPDGGSSAIAAEPVTVAAPPASSPTPVPVASATPPAASATPPAPPAGNCRTRTARAARDIVGSERTLTGAMAPVLDVMPGEQLCVETQKKHWQLVGLQLVPAAAHPDRSLSITLSSDAGKGATLTIENPYNMMLHYSLAVLRPGKKKREHAVACPVEPGKSKQTHFKGPLVHVFVSNLHLKGPGTAGSMLCQ